MKDWQKLLIALGVCAVFLAAAYFLMHEVESPAERGFREAIRRFLESK